MSSPNSTENSQNNTASDSVLHQADIFAGIFQCEALRFKYGNANQLRQAIKQLRACLDMVDKLLGEEHRV